MQTLDCFVRGKFNVLVATSVAEEGLDLPACQLVVSFCLSRLLCSSHLELNLPLLVGVSLHPVLAVDPCACY